jgi:enoyl-CoA hydratase
VSTDATEQDQPVMLVEIADRIAVATMNRPKSRNALNRVLDARLGEVMVALDHNDSVDVIILTGTDPAFCAGVDLKEAGTDGGVLGQNRTYEGRRGMFPQVTKPVIGAVNGPAITGGLEVALTCDFLVASERARFADTHTRVGVMPGGGVTVRLARWIGVPRAREMSVTGNFVDAPTALAWGLVNHVVPHEQLIDFCKGLAADIVSNDQRGVRQMLDTYDRGAGAAEDDAWEIERRISAQWGGDGYDPAEIEARRLDVVARGRKQM